MCVYVCERYSRILHQIKNQNGKQANCSTSNSPPAQHAARAQVWRHHSQAIDILIPDRDDSSWLHHEIILHVFGWSEVIFDPDKKRATPHVVADAHISSPISACLLGGRVHQIIVHTNIRDQKEVMSRGI